MGVSVCLCKHPGVHAINNLFNIKNDFFLITAKRDYMNLEILHKEIYFYV